MATTRTRLVEASVTLFGRKGYTGTGVKEILAAARAPMGSMYHHFPEGKEQLGAEAVRASGALYAQLAEAVLDPAPDLVSGVDAFFRLAGVHLAQSGWADACPIATVALETSSVSEPLRQACHEVFELWLAALEPRLAAGGIAPDRARPLALVMLSQLEGAFVLARAARSTEALDAAADLMACFVARELAA